MRLRYWVVGLLLVGLVLADPTSAQSEKPEAARDDRAQVLVILKKLETVKPFHCTSMTTVIGTQGEGRQNPAARTAKIWQKGPYFRAEQADETIINRPEGFFLYEEKTGTYTQPPDFAKVAILQTFKVPPNASTTVEQIWSDALDSTDLRILGTDVIDGKEATRIAYTTSPFGGRVDVKLWLWNDKGLALKTEATSFMNEQPTATEITEWRDFVFEDIPDSLFDVQQEKIQKLPENWHL